MFSRTAHIARSTCGLLPLCALLVISLSVRVQAAFKPAPAVKLEVIEPSGDSAIIDQVLAKRAPELGLILRRQLGLAITEEAQKAGFDPLLIMALIDVESDFAEDAVSDKGARGLMQIKPSTLQYLAWAEGLHLKLDEIESDPALCIRLGVRYLKQLQDRFGELDMALMAYNAGPAKIRQARKEKEDGGLEPYFRYPRAVRRDFRRFREGQGLLGDWALARRQP